MDPISPSSSTSSPRHDLSASTADILNSYGIHRSPSSNNLTEAEKQNYAKTLWQVVEKNNDNTFAHFVKEPSLFSRIWQQFLRLLRWLFRIPQPISDEEMRLRYAMHLFNNHQPKILEQGAEKGEDQISFSTSLEAQCHFLKSFQDQLNLPTHKLEALEQCLEIAKEIENARESSTFFRNGIVRDLTSQIQEKIDSLQPNESIYFPGGLMDYHDLSDLLKGTKKHEFAERPLSTTHMIYEVVKNPPSSKQNLTLRIYQYSSLITPLIHHEDGLMKLWDARDIKSNTSHAEVSDFPPSPVTEYVLSTDDFFPHLETLIDVQTTPHIAHNMNKWSLFWYNPPTDIKRAAGKNLESNSLRKKIQETWHHALGPLLEDLSVYRFAETLNTLRPFKQERSLIECKVNLSPQTNPLTTLHVFSKATSDPQRLFRQLLEKTTLFLEIYDASQDKLDDDFQLCQWLSGNAIHLIKSYKHVFHNLGNTDLLEYKSLLKHFEDIVNLLQDKCSLQPFELPPDPIEQKDLCLNFEDPLLTTETYTQPDTYVETNAKNTAYCEPLTRMHLNSDNPQKAWESLEEGLRLGEELSQKCRFQELHFLLKDMAYAMENGDRTNIWEQIFIEQTEKWSLALHRLCILTAQVHFRGHLPGPLPKQIVFLLKNLLRCQKLAHLNNESTSFQGFALDMEPFIDVLRDPYLDLGEEGPIIKQTIDAIEKSGLVKVNLTDPSPCEDQQESDKAFFDAYKSQHPAWRESKETRLESDFSGGIGKLALQVVHLRRMKILALAMVAKYRCLGNRGLWDSLKTSIKSCLSLLRGQASNFDADILHRIFTEIDDHLYTSEAPETMSKHRLVLYDRPTVKIHEYGLNYFDYHHSVLSNLGPPFASQRTPSQYKKTAPEVPLALAESVIEACVSNEDTLFVDEDGFKLDPKVCGEKQLTSYVPCGETKTEGSINNDHTSELFLMRDRWADLRNMQTKPSSTRILNTLALFHQNFGYLGHPKYGKAFQRLFTLNLFRNNALGNYLLANPEKHVMVSNYIVHIAQSLRLSGDLQGMLFMLTVTESIERILEEQSAICPEALSFVRKEHVNQLILWQEQCEKQQHLTAHRHTIHYVFLLHFAHMLDEKFQDLDYDPLKDAEISPYLLKILRSYYLSKQIALPPQQKVRAHEDKCNYMMHRLFPAYRSHLSKEQDRNSFLNQLLKIDDTTTLWKPLPEPFCYESENLQVDLWSGLLYVNQVATCYLPDSITHVLKQLNKDETVHTLVHTVTCKRKNIVKEGKKGTIYEFEFLEERFQAVLLPGQEPHIYKWIELPSNNAMWMQLMRINTPSKQTEAKKTFLANAAILMDSSDEAIQHIPKVVSVKHLPSDLTENLFWINLNEQHFKVETVAGKFLYYGRVKQSESSQSTQSVLEITEINYQVTNETLFNPWDIPAFKHFLALANATHILALGPLDKVQTIKYLEFPLEYHWEEDVDPKGFMEEVQENDPTKPKQDPTTSSNKSIWTSTFPGYSLSSLRMHSLKPKFFATSFENYHILTHKSKLPKLLVVGNQYEYATPLHAHHKDLKIVDRCRTEEPSVLYSYDIDPQLGLIPVTPEGYLYLAYLLFTQANYEEALHYLYKAQNIRPGESKSSDTIFEWFEKWSSTSKRSQQFILHVRLLMLMQLQRFDLKSLNERQSLPLIEKVVSSFALYLTLEKSIKLDRGLLLSYSHRALLNKYLELIAPELSENLDNSSANLVSSLGNFLQQLCQEIKRVLNQNDTNCLDEEKKIEVEINHLNDEIQNNKIFNDKQAAKQKKSDGSTLNTRYFHFIFAEHEDVTEKVMQSKHLTTFEKHTKQLQDTMSAMLQGPNSDDHEDLSFASELAESLLKDTEYASKTERFTKQLHHNMPIASLKAKFQTSAARWNDESEQKKKKILELLDEHHVTKNPWSAMLQHLKRSPDSSERYFWDALHCCATGDWRSLEKAGIVRSHNLEKLIKEINSYLIVKITAQQYQKIIELMDLYEKTFASRYVYKIGVLLGTQRHYNPDTHPYRFKFLLLEMQKQIILTKEQIQNILATADTPNLFMHQFLGGGKTTVLRNENAHQFADGVNIAGVITDDALIGVHHPLLQQTSLEAFGKLATLLSSERNDLSDTLYWKVKLRNILRTAATRGRLDTTPRFLLSLHHAPKEKYNQLRNPKRGEEEIHKELDLICDTIQKLQANAIIGADEIDHILRPNVQHNYGIGNERGLDPTKCNAALKIVEWTLLDETYKTYFKTNTQYKLTLSQEMLQSYLRMIAEHVYEEYMQDITDDKELAIDYLIKPLDPRTDQHLKEKLDQLYDRHLKANSKTPHRDLIVSFHKYLHSILPKSLELRNGTKYIRANNGRDVKPTCRNATYNPNSERCSEEASIFETLQQYMDTVHVNSGVTESQITQLVIDLKRLASKEVLESLKEERPRKFDETKVAQDFLRDFGYSIQDIGSEDYLKIATSINNDPCKLTQFLRQYVLPATLLREKKWEGNAHDLVNMVSQFYGTSGTSNSYRSLPDKIYVDPYGHPEYIKQPGSDGSVIFAILKDYAKKDIITILDNEDPTTIIVSHVAPTGSLLIDSNKPGGLFIDLAAIYAGMTGEQLAKKFTTHLNPTHPVRYVSVDEGEMVVSANAEIPQQFDPLKDLSKATTVLVKDQERGTNLETDVECVEYISVNRLTTLTEFNQAAKRLRNLGKGGKCKIINDEDTKKKMSDLLRMIVTFCINEARQLKSQHFLKEVQRIESYAKIAIYNDLLIKLKDRKLRLPIWNAVEHFFTKDTQESLSEMGRPQFQQMAHDYLKSLAEKECHKVRALQKTLSAFASDKDVEALLNTLKDVEKILEKMSLGTGLMLQKYLPVSIEGAEVNIETQNYSTIEQEEEKFQETIQYQNQVIEQKKPLEAGKAWLPIKFSNVKEMMSEFQTHENNVFTAVHTFAPLYDNNLFITINVTPGSMLRSSHLILVVQKQTHQMQGILGTKKDMDHVFSVIDQADAQSPDYDYYIYNLSTDVLESTLTQWKPYPANIFAQIQKLIAQSKLLTGEVDLEKEQLAVFKDWLKTKGSQKSKETKQIEKQFLEQLNLHRPSQLADYPASHMAKALRGSS